MKIPKTVPISDFRINQAGVIENLQHGPLLIMSRNQPVGVFIRVDEWNCIQEKLMKCGDEKGK